MKVIHKKIRNGLRWMIKYFVIMPKNKKYLFFLFCILSIIISNFVYVKKVFASPSITSFLLNGVSQSATINPNNGESVSIEVKASTPVKFTRLYICSISQVCNGTSGNYTKYFIQTDISDTVNKTWDGKNSAGNVVSEGEYKVMASMVEGSNLAVTQFGQYSIFINYSISSSSTEVTSTASSSDSTTTSTNTSTTTNLSSTTSPTVITRTVYVSAHSSTEDLSNYTEKIVFQTSAGRERMALVGSPLEFDAKYFFSNINQCTPIFRWSFGDGFDEPGKNITHTYKHAGEYQVVLNGICGEESSVSRTIVKVIIPEVSVAQILSGDIEIKNKGKTEINIGDWKIRGIEKYFIFPKDTIISAGNKIILSKEDLNISSSTERIALVNPSGREVTYFNIISKEQGNSVLSMVATTTQAVTLSDNPSISVADAEVLVEQYKKQVAVSQIPQKTKLINNNSINSSDKDNTQEVATVAEAITSSSTKSFWAKMIEAPINGLKAFARIFYNF